MKNIFLPQTRKKIDHLNLTRESQNCIILFFLVETENRSLEVLHQGPEIDGQKSIDQFG